MAKDAWDPPLAGDVVAERTIERLRPDGSLPGKITIYRPVPTGPGEWGCRYTISGIRDDGSTVDEVASGVDSAQALQSALFLVGVAFICEPVVTEEGGAAWNPLPRTHVDDLIPLPSSHKRLAGADGVTDLDEGVATLRTLREWLETTKETAGAEEKLEGLERGMRQLQSSGRLPVQEADIVRIAELRAALGGGATHETLLPIVERCLLWWTRASQSSG